MDLPGAPLWDEFLASRAGARGGIREAQRRGATKALLWPWRRMTAYRRVQAITAAAGIADGPHACPKGLPHGFGVQAVSRGIAPNMEQK